MNIKMSYNGIRLCAGIIVARFLCCLTLNITKMQKGLVQDMKNILFVASEAVPFMKTGGLADVVGSLPKCFDKRYFDV